MPLTSTDLDTMLASALFKRTPFSVSMGSVGVAIMAYPHIGVAPFSRVLAWVSGMLVLLCVRLLMARRNLVALASSDQTPGQLLAQDAVVSALLGAGWGLSFYAFDSQVMDQNYYFRVMILAVALAIIVFSTGAIYQVFLAYALPVVVIGMGFAMTHEYVKAAALIYFLVPLYLLLLMAMSRVIRRSIVDEYALVEATQALNQALLAEKKLKEEVTLISRMDDLTGALNRRGILENLDIEIAKARRHNWPLSVFVMDIDRFKLINDTHGHASGDAALRAVTQAGKQMLRESDVLGRLGGDEIMVVLPALGSDEALATAARMRACIESLETDADNCPCKVTLSIGVATFRQEDDSAALLLRADTALYLAKDKGRNRVEQEAPAAL